MTKENRITWWHDYAHPVIPGMWLCSELPVTFSDLHLKAKPVMQSPSIAPGGSSC